MRILSSPCFLFQPHDFRTKKRPRVHQRWQEKRVPATGSLVKAGRAESPVLEVMGYPQMDDLLWEQSDFNDFRWMIYDPFFETYLNSSLRKIWMIYDLRHGNSGR